MMHAADQSAALAERAARVSPGGVLLLQYHSLDTIIRCGQWNALRHGHYAYYSTTALAAMLAAHGFSRARRRGSSSSTAARCCWPPAVVTGAGAGPDGPVQSLLEEDARVGVRDAGVLLVASSAARRARPRDCTTGWWPSDPPGGPCSDTVPPRARSPCCARRGVDRALLPAVVDASPAKQGLRMPGTDIPVVDPSQLARIRQTPCCSS